VIEWFRTKTIPSLKQKLSLPERETCSKIRLGKHLKYKNNIIICRIKCSFSFDMKSSLPWRIKQLIRLGLSICDSFDFVRCSWRKVLKAVTRSAWRERSREHQSRNTSLSATCIITHQDRLIGRLSLSVHFTIKANKVNYIKKDGTNCSPDTHSRLRRTSTCSDQLMKWMDGKML
jgi:hypothetical protein